MPEKTICRVLGFDFGLKRIGLASGQTITNTASPIKILAAQDGVPDWKEVGSLIKEWAPDALIVGLPVNMDGTGNEISHLAEKFARKLEGRFNKTVILMDERLSSRAVQDELDALGEGHRPNRRRVDDLAACVIVESWLRENA